MAVIALACAVMAACELMRGLAVLQRFVLLHRVAVRAYAVLVHRGGSDWSKERATRILAGRMFRRSADALAGLAIAVTPILAVLFVDRLIPYGAATSLFDWSDRLLILAASIVYAVCRKRVPQFRRALSARVPRRHFQTDL